VSDSLSRQSSTDTVREAMRAYKRARTELSQEGIVGQVAAHLAERDRYRAALELIVTATCVAPGDVVDIARKALDA
jgi:chromosome segregation ATPase